MYLKNRDGQVVSVGADGACEWRSGSIQKHWDHIVSSSGGSSATFRLFDHITVSGTKSVTSGSITGSFLEPPSSLHRSVFQSSPLLSTPTV